MVDYSKWDHIEVSDDEDETHPNIDTPSLFRWRHQARVEKMEERKKEREEMDRKLSESKAKLERVRKKMESVDVSSAEHEEMKEKLQKLELQHKELREQDDKLTNKERKDPKNVDTLSKDGFTKTIINKPKPKMKLSEEEEAQQNSEFMDAHEKEIKHFGMLQDFNDSEEYLAKHPHLTCDATANYLALWCINLEVQEKHSLMERVAHQCIIMQYILQLSQSLEADPRSTVHAFFVKMKRARTDYKEYMDAFEDELTQFKIRVKGRAEARIEKAIKEAEEEERQNRLGPGGLDPVEVMESLPKELQDCFETKDIQMLQNTLGAMPEDVARYHLKRCVDSGLWIPNAKEAEENARRAAAGSEVEDEPLASEYATVGDADEK